MPRRDEGPAYHSCPRRGTRSAGSDQAHHQAVFAFERNLHFGPGQGRDDEVPHLSCLTS